MPVYTYIDACGDLAELLNEARKNNEVIIKTDNGDLFSIKFAAKKSLRADSLRADLPDIGVNLSRDEIVSYIREIRERE